MSSEMKTQSVSQSPFKRKSLLVEMFKSFNGSSGKSTPQSGKSSDQSPLRKQSCVKTPTTTEKEQEKRLYKKAYNAILDGDLQAIDQVLLQLQKADKNINSSLNSYSFDQRALIHLVAETLDQYDIVLKYLIEQKGADVFIKDSFGNNALHLACKKGKLEAVKYLQSLGLNLSEQNKLGDYSVTLASYSGSLELVKYLQSQKIPMNVLNLNNQSAWDIAFEKNHQEVFSYLAEILENAEQ